MNSTTITLADAEARSGRDLLAHLDRQAAVPVVSMDAPACQGDVSIVPMDHEPATTRIPRSGVVVGRSWDGGHQHRLTGRAFFDFHRCGSDLTIGVLTVPAGVDVLLTHPEHGAFLILEGTYRMGRQREFAGRWRTACD
jgi:hypothetical protein